MNNFILSGGWRPYIGRPFDKLDDALLPEVFLDDVVATNALGTEEGFTDMFNTLDAAALAAAYSHRNYSGLS